MISCATLHRKKLDSFTFHFGILHFVFLKYVDFTKHLRSLQDRKLIYTFFFKTLFEFRATYLFDFRAIYL